mgnify:CR=1 FL=1
MPPTQFLRPRASFQGFGSKKDAELEILSFWEYTSGHRIESGPDSGVGTPDCLFSPTVWKFPPTLRGSLENITHICRVWQSRSLFSRLGCVSRLPDCWVQSGCPTVECPTVSPTLSCGQVEMCPKCQRCFSLKLEQVQHHPS